jgi:hypothetical protein
MLEWLKSTWTNWKITIAVVGSAIVVATAYGTCTYEPASEEVSAAPAPADVETTPAGSIENSGDATTTGDQNTSETIGTTETTGTTGTTGTTTATE